MMGILTLVGIFALAPYSGEIVSQAQALQAPFDAKMFSALLMPLCFMFVEQDMAQRCFSAKSPKDATVGSLVTAALLVCLTIIPTSCGILGKALGVSPDQGSIFIQVMQKIANPVVFTLAASAVLLAIISTSSSLLLAVSSNVAQDLTKRQNCKTYTAIVGIIALLGPYLANDIISGLVTSYEISVAAFFVPLMAAIFSKKSSLPREAAWSSAVFGLAGFCFSKMLPQVPITSLASLSFSLIGFLAGMAYVRIYKKTASQVG
jgi:SSS family solute:Na+ symporter